MSRWLAVSGFAFILLVPFSWAQNQQNFGDQNASTAGSDLVAWTDMQQPQPIPQANPAPGAAPEPVPETPAPRTQPPASKDPSGSQSSGQPSGSAGQSAEASSQSFSGTISKDGDDYVLKVTDTSSYKLDDQGQAKQFEGQKVRVTGALDAATNMIHVQKIEPLA